MLGNASVPFFSDGALRVLEVISACTVSALHLNATRRKRNVRECSPSKPAALRAVHRYRGRSEAVSVGSEI